MLFRSTVGAVRCAHELVMAGQRSSHTPGVRPVRRHRTALVHQGAQVWVGTERPARKWVAGTGTDTRPNRVLNPVRQGERYDRDGAYIRRWVPELSGLTGRHLHQPWRLKDSERRRLGYPDPIVNLDDARTRLLASRN